MVKLPVLWRLIQVSYRKTWGPTQNRHRATRARALVKERASDLLPAWSHWELEPYLDSNLAQWGLQVEVSWLQNFPMQYKTFAPREGVRKKTEFLWLRMCDSSKTGFENKMKIENLKNNENRKPEKKLWSKTWKKTMLNQQSFWQAAPQVFPHTPTNNDSVIPNNLFGKSVVLTIGQRYFQVWSTGRDSHRDNLPLPVIMCLWPACLEFRITP